MGKKRAFIYGTIYVDTPFKAEYVQMWIELNQKLNPDIDLLIVDSQSDRIWLNLIPGIKDVPIHVVKEGDQMPPLQSGVNWIDFPENMGHLNFNGIDGWGRAFCRGIEYAIQHDYEYVINIECDMFFGKPVAPILDQMDQHNLHVLSTDLKYTNFPHYMMENTIIFMRTSYLKDVDFIKKYDWRRDWKGSGRQYEIPEQRCLTLLEPEVFYKHWDGVRGWAGAQSIIELSDIDHLDYLMHAEFAEYPHPHELNYAFLRRFLGQDWIPPHRRSAAP